MNIKEISISIEKNVIKQILNLVARIAHEWFIKYFLN